MIPDSTRGARLDASATLIVPARLASTRFPEKILASSTGKPLVQHVVERAALARCAREVVVAADDKRVVDALRSYGTRVILTRVDHPNGTSRLSEAAELLGLGDDQIVVNVQGDEPELDAEAIDSSVGSLLMHASADVGTVAAPIVDARELADPNVVKVVRAIDGRALYFSRAPIPFDRDARGAGGAGGTSTPAATPGALRHVGVYAYRVKFLRAYASLAITPLEHIEKLEQLRVLEHAHVIAVGLCRVAHPGIDTPEQYEAFVRRYTARAQSNREAASGRVGEVGRA
jgi:3-deoxy-manno-octulosonate cytidylyltransferase (CMP-KDO synthetase)